MIIVASEMLGNQFQANASFHCNVIFGYVVIPHLLLLSIKQFAGYVVKVLHLRLL